MIGLSQKLVEHRLPIKLSYKPYRQSPRRMLEEIEMKVKEKIQRLLKVGFIRPTRYVEWLSYIVLVVKKNGKLRVCVDFKNLNSTTLKD